jgi:SAM-dependent methyltransferase
MHPVPGGRTIEGLKRLAGAAYGGGEHWLSGHVLERRYGLPRSASGVIELDAVGYAGSSRNGYGPGPWGALHRVLRRGEVSPEDVFVDFGCGLGRVVVEAAGYPFKRVTGIELVPAFAAVARDVVERNRTRFRCRDVDVIASDALDYAVPDDLTIAYFANPFGGEVLDVVIDRLIESHHRRPRRLWIIYLALPPDASLRHDPRIRFVRYGRRGVRRWAEAKYLALYEVSS